MSSPATAQFRPGGARVGATVGLPTTVGGRTVAGGAVGGAVRAYAVGPVVTNIATATAAPTLLITAATLRAPLSAGFALLPGGCGLRF